MCVRYALNTPATSADAMLHMVMESLERRFPGMAKTGEIGPGDTAPALIGREGRVVAVPAVFGWPGFDGGRPLVNARAETAAGKPTFAESLGGRRHVLPATGRYEGGRGAGGPEITYHFPPRGAPAV